MNKKNIILETFAITISVFGTIAFLSVMWHYTRVVQYEGVNGTQADINWNTAKQHPEMYLWLAAAFPFLMAYGIYVHSMKRKWVLVFIDGVLLPLMFVGSYLWVT